MRPWRSMRGSSARKRACTAAIGRRHSGQRETEDIGDDLQGRGEAAPNRGGPVGVKRNVRRRSRDANSLKLAEAVMRGGATPHRQEASGIAIPIPLEYAWNYLEMK